MTVTEKASPANIIQIEVLVPARVDREACERVEDMMIDFMFGSDRVRPELREDLSAAGVDFNHLAELSQNPRIGVCPSPGAREFIPSEHLVRVCAAHGIDLTSGGSVIVTFNYDAYADETEPTDQLEVNLTLPAGVGGEVTESADLVADIVRALFGDCQLPAPAQAYLRTHGVDLTEVVARNVDRLGGPDKPFTSRVSPEVHRLLTEAGFALDQFGQFSVKSVTESASLARSCGAWSKTTCC